MTIAFCRTCAAGGDGVRCASCGADRFVAHAEAASLSIAHLDCDAFYATIEKRDDPSLAAKPVIIGGGKRGVVATACYVARAYGVRSAMPMFKALKLCPHAVVIKPNIAKYAAIGADVRARMEALTPHVQPLSIDEAFMDLTGTQKLHHGAPVQTLIALQNNIERDMRISVSIGLSFNKFLAKTASDLDKPRGFSVIGRGEALAFLAPRSVATLPGVGPAGAKALAKHGYATIGDLRAAGAPVLQAKLGDWGLRLYDFSIAHDARAVDSDGERKTISAETTFFEDMAEREWLEDVLWDLCEKVAARARANQVGGRTITLKLRRADFKIITRRRQLGEPTLLAARLFEVGRTLLSAEANGRTQFRLIGIGLSDFDDAANADQGDMLDTQTPKRAATEDAIAKARAKFGKDAVLSGRSLKKREGE